jgi:hypothetical protein
MAIRRYRVLPPPVTRIFMQEVPRLSNEYRTFVRPITIWTGRRQVLGLMKWRFVP